MAVRREVLRVRGSFLLNNLMGARCVIIAVEYMYASIYISVNICMSVYLTLLFVKSREVLNFG